MSPLPPLGLGETPPFPRCIEIQTTNVCNARCTVCPYEATTALERKARMEEALFDRLVDQCADSRSHLERLIPYLNNEPFADPQIIPRLRKIRDRVGVHVELSTNAALLDEERARVLVAEQLVHTLRISMFGSDQERYEARMLRLRWKASSDNVARLLNLRRALGAEERMVVEIIMVGTPDLAAEEVLSARRLWGPLGASVRIFGFLDRASNHTFRNLLPDHQAWGQIRGCELNRPYERMAIRADGTCVLCSQDWRGEVVLGNANTSELAAIWNGSAYQRLRSEVSGRVRAADDHFCRRCKLAIVQ